MARLRWVWLAAQAAAVATAHMGYGVALPVEGVAAVIVAGVVANALAAYRPSAVVEPLMLDVALFGALLALSGGLANPFAALLPAPALVCVISTVPGRTARVAAAVVLVASLLAFARAPIEPAAWLAASAMAGLAALAGHALERASKGRRGARADAEPENAAADIAFAAAAHEIATPLSTITVAAAELARDLTDGSATREDALLIAREAKRCRAILDAAREAVSSGTALPVTEIVARAAEPHRGRGVDIRILSEGGGSEPRIDGSAEAVLGIRNIIQNAVDFADGDVSVAIAWTTRTAEVTIVDDGPGFDPEILAGAPPEPDRPRPRGGPGTGRGLALARALLARGGGVVDLGAATRKGARVRVTWRFPDRDG